MFPLAIYLCSKEEPETSLAWAPFLLEQELLLMVSRSLSLAFWVCSSRAGPGPSSPSHEIDVTYQVGLSCLISFPVCFPQSVFRDVQQASYFIF